MSSNRELNIVETDNGWFYIIEDATAPVDSWDWIEFSQCFGPFDSEESANKHCYEMHGSTSGHTILEKGDSMIDASIMSAIENANDPR